MKTSFFSATLVVSAVLFVQADVLTPSGGDDTAAIQAAIDAAPDGGTVTLGDGEFLITSQIEITRDVTLKSQNGRSATTIRQTRTELPSGVTSLANRVLYLNHAKAVADGLKLTGGKALGTAAASSNGAGVKIDTDGGQVLNCTVVRNSGYFGSAGIQAVSADAVVRNCLVQGNVLKEGTTSSTTNLAYAADACVSYCLSPDPMPADQGNVTGMVTLRRDDRPKPRSLAQDAGSTDGYDCGTLDLVRNPRVRGRSIDIGCHEVPNAGLSVVVR